MTINKDMLISEILQVDRGLAGVLMSHGMACVGCPSAQYESLEQAAIGHGMNADVIVEEMNAFLAENANK